MSKRDEVQAGPDATSESAKTAEVLKIADDIMKRYAEVLKRLEDA